MAEAEGWRRNQASTCKSMISVLSGMVNAICLGGGNSIQVHLINTLDLLKGPALCPLLAAALSDQVVLFVG